MTEPVLSTSSPAATPALPAGIPTSAVQRSRWIAFVSCLALVALGLLWELVLARTGNGTLAIKVLPLVLALPGLWRMRLYTYRWMSLAVWLYAAEGAVRVNSAPGPEVPLAAVELVLSVLLFTACAWHVRARLAAGRLAAAAT
ncbi:DUF2069 domain-containing protein [uncultured Sphaerotilus sp.]|uniref:DUF2069 domain-containing protein n=1 Tax=uncultured Sphaerotilus sp. TaxID=474984 RepID=UPI0030CA3D1A